MLSLLIVASLTAIECPKWLPGTNHVLPEGVQLSPQQELENKLRCYCTVVKQSEESCLQSYSKQECEERTKAWVISNFPNFNLQPGQNTPRRALRMISIEP